MLFPFTRLVHIVSAPVWYLGRRYQIVRQKGTRPVAPRPVMVRRDERVESPEPGYVPAPRLVRDNIN